uniref:Zinc transporter ZIP10 n=1 Tax=Macrostomum lignano TaxID=282301 RepID=A0A1I8FL23_9PLAT
MAAQTARTVRSGSHSQCRLLLAACTHHASGDMKIQKIPHGFSVASSPACVKFWLISLVGLAGVAVVPLVQSELLQPALFSNLVALALDSLTGDAMLHLLPHAIVKSAMEDTHAEKYHKEVQTVYKGLVALGGEEERKEQEEGHPNRMSTLERQKRRASRLYGGKSCEDIITTGLSSKAMRSIDNFRSYLEYSDSEDGGGPPSDQQGELRPRRRPVKQRYRPYRRNHPLTAAGNGGDGGGGGGGGGRCVKFASSCRARRARQAGQDEAKEPAGHSQAAAASGHGHGHGGENSAVPGLRGLD